jgi:hypothetical protein
MALLINVLYIALSAETAINMPCDKMVEGIPSFDKKGYMIFKFYILGGVRGVYKMKTSS